MKLPTPTLTDAICFGTYNIAENYGSQCATVLARKVSAQRKQLSAARKLLERITNHPQLPTDSLQCLRDARRFLGAK